ncbi:hypothetical protein A6R68_07736 [Neotoma lepida]|uniref:Uncharacterized protein n=1 Tax=Neotoma lepida TaxID=56216 RepID=A0A1A6GEI2_NEOLE|nr:hypothetical protein A6R68_07736 [Neotoma lepida]
MSLRTSTCLLTSTWKTTPRVSQTSHQASA